MKVVIIGASGETGRSIVNGLVLSPNNFDITAVSRSSSINSKHNQALKELGVRVVAGDFGGAEADWVRLFTGADVVISAINAYVLEYQIPLIDAAKKAGVGRFIPCSFATVTPPRGVTKLRDMKEDVIDHIKRIYLPYTVIDVGWWYQISPPRLPSGRIDYAVLAPVEQIIGDGTVPSALTALPDIGRYVARIIADPRTLNKMVFAYNEVLTQTQVFDTMERLSGEKLERSYLSKAELDAQLAKAREAVRAGGAGDQATMRNLFMAEYRHSWGIRGDNTPEHARYLGYLSSKELYPDLEFTSFESFVRELLEGKGMRLYA